MVTYAKKLGEAVTGANISENNGTSSQADGETGENARALTIGEQAIISSVTISDRATGTGPWDDDNEPGNDMDAENNIVRSFDQVTWTTELTFDIKEGAGVDSVTGGTIEFEVSLPEECSEIMEWNLEEMKWVEGGTLSEDGRTLTGKYIMEDETTTVPGKQTLVFVLNVGGASNGTEIQPSFSFKLTGNEENEKIETTVDKVQVSAKGKYNIELVQNRWLKTKTTVDYGNGETAGRMYGYGYTVQLYNESESKGLKGLEYPKGEISFDIELKLERSKIGSNELEDITDEATPILWNYSVNDWDDNTGNIENREMYNEMPYSNYNFYTPLGIDTGDRLYSTYNSGDIYIVQEKNVLSVKVNNYEFDGTFPMLEAAYDGVDNNNRAEIYTENIGTFSVGYMQIFVPDTIASSMDNMNYYLTISDMNMNVVSQSNETITKQMNSQDDTKKVQHYYKMNGAYSQSINIFNGDDTKQLEDSGMGNASTSVNSKIILRVASFNDASNDYEIYTINKFIKFDGNALEPIYWSDGSKYKGDNRIKYKIWYTTKKDGTNWVSQDEMNNSNIEEMDIYENIEDIPKNKTCTGIYIESIDGCLARKDYSSHIKLLFKIKEDAKIGQTYGMTHRTWFWKETLDRSTYTIENKDIKYLEDWPETEWDSGNLQYIKTEYDENGQIVPGTNSGSYFAGNTILIIGGELSGQIKAVDNTNTEKVNYDLGRNESTVTYSVEPQLDSNENVASQIENVTLKAKVTLPAGLTYVAGSSKRGGKEYREPEITENEDGTTLLTWYIYEVTSGEEIEPILFDAQISNSSKNNQQYDVTFVVSEEIGTDGISKIGNSEISNRTSSTTINIINLSSYRLYKEVETPIVEANGEITYKVTYENNADTPAPEFQVLDILPYNGDGRGTSYNGTYTLKNVKVTQTGENGDEESTDNLRLYTTTSPDARRITPKDESIGVSEIWNEKEIGEEINEAVTVIALKGEIGRNTEIQIEITLQTTNNRGGDTYYNQATAQVSKDSEVITTTNIKAEVVARQISGKIWYDTNENGVIDEDEGYASRIEVELLKADGSKAVDYNGNEITNILTDSNGEYSFSNLPMGEYIVEIKPEDRYTLTEANVGTNREINSKFEETEEGEKQSYTITNLNGIQSPEIIEANVNAGLVVKDAKIIVKYLEEDATPETDEDNKVLKTQDEITTYDKDGVPTKYKLGDNYSTEAAEIENYISLRNSGNTRGTLNTEETIVTYYYTYNLQDITVSKVWEDNHDTAQKRPASIKVTLKDGAEEVKEIVLNSSNFVETEQAGITGISGTAEVWQGTIEDVAIYNEAGERISYTIDEKEDIGTLDSYNKTINGMVITNTFTQNTEKIEIPVTKVWEDSDNKAGKRPTNLTLILKREVGSSYVEASRATINAEENQGSNSNEWTYTFTDIAKYDENNNEIKYVVEEETPEFYTSRVESVENTGEDIAEFRITNTFEVPDEKVSYEVTKIWNDNNNRAGKRPEEVTLVLTGKNQQGEVVVEPQRITLTKTDAIDGNTEGTTDTSTTWKGTISNLPRYDENADLITYELSEESLNNIFYTEVNTTINQETKTVTNKFEVPDEQIAIEVTKVWDDNNNAEGERPESVTLYLTGNGQESEITLTKANAIDGNTEGTTDTSTTWRGTISNLPKYDVNGNEINYILDERPVASEFYTKTNVEQESKTVTNRFAIPTENIQITVTKIWEDNENELGKRPENITLQIINKATGEIVASQLVQGSSTSNEGWSYTFEVPKYAGSTDEVEYEIGEADLNNIFYTNENAEINQETRTITNRFEIPDETIEITVTKIWVEEVEDGRKARPEEIIIEVIDEAGKVVKEEPMTEENQLEDNVNIWQTTIEVAKYNEQAEEKTYTIDEKEAEALENYEKKIEGTTITNTYIGPVIEAEKEVTTEMGLNYVVEGERITYTIRVENSGDLAGDVLVKDSIPEGTTFVAGSIKVNDEAQEEMTAEDLANGITVNVPARENETTPGEITVSFEVTVNELEGDSLTATIRNVATINKDPDDPESEDEPTNETETTVNKSNLQYSKTSNPASGNTVKKGDEITYTIHLDNTTGTAPISVIVKDEIPVGTTFVEGSIKVNGVIDSSKTADDLANGINVDLEAGESKDVEFKVTVNDLNNGDKITNIATIDRDPEDSTNPEENTKETEHTYIEPVIDANKEVATEMGLSYVVEGEKITYTIRVQNSGDLAGDVIVKDNIPDGTTFVEESIKINGVTDDTKTAEDLANGITVNVPARENEATPGEITVSFEVTVNELEGEVLTATIRNVATINKDPDDPESPDEPTNETETTVNKSNLQYNKTSNPESGNTVKEGDEITYTIHLDNTTGTAPISVIVKDEIPEGTTFVDRSIKVNGVTDSSKTADDLANGINVDLEAGESKDIEFKVTVNDLNNGDKITNIATIDKDPEDPTNPEENTNETEHTYIEPVINAEKEVATEMGLSYVVEGEKITYTIRVQNSGDLAGDVVVKDSIPEGTTFVEGSIKIDGVTDDTKTDEDLANGITVNVPARENEDTSGIVELSFEVTVDELEGEALTETIRNVATINKDPENPESPDEPTNETETTVNKSNLQYNKTSNPASGNTVKEGDEITYTIHLDNTTGTAPISVVVKDEIPEGTTFVDGSIRVNDEAQEELNATNLANGINVDLEAGESKDVEFKVTVNDLNNGDKIRNVATIDRAPDDPSNAEENTNETEHTYIEPVIDANKEVATENGLNYIVEGEKITYTIRVQNSGDLAGDVVVKDSIPDGTTFVKGSIKINEEAQEEMTADDLADGITVTVPASSETAGGANQGGATTEATAGEVTVSFEVTVNELEGDTLTATIRNVATINKAPDDPESEDEPTNETETTVNKSNLQYSKTSNPASGNTVKEGDEITYTIHLDNTTGTAPISVIVKDEIPEGTTFVAGSIRVNDEVQEGLNATDLSNGINVDLEAGESKDIEFKVTVNDLDNGDEIRNIATIDNDPDDPTNAEESTNETEHTYIEPVIDANKEVATEMGLSYVVEGEKITYTINVENRGDLAGNVIVKDSIPAGTTFVAGSIKVNGTQDASKTADDLAQGITVYVPARESDEIPGEGRVSFDVIVDEVGENETSKTIRNTAYINKNPEDSDEPTNEVSVPVLIYNKKAEIIRIADEDIEEGAVTAGDRIKYTITINNVGDEAIEDVKIKDKVPEGTTIYQINDNGEISLNDANIITWNIDRIEATEEVEVSFEVTVNYDTEEKTITNVGTVDGKETNKVETPYKVPELVLESSIVKDGTNRITNTDEKISYTINYKAEIRGFVGKGSIQIVDYLPYEIEEENSELNGGTYNSEDKTITWEEDLNNIDTYINEEGITTIEKIKTITLKYIYPDEENLSGTIENRVEGTISLTQEQEVEDPSNPEGTVTEDVVVREETKEDNHEVNVEIPAKVIVHHYIYDEAQGGETTEEVPAIDGGVVAEETINGYVGNEYNTSPSDKVNHNYECINTEPENKAGTMTKTDIEVTYYYKLKEAEIGAEIEKTAEASRGNVLTQEDGVVRYSIVYKPEITNYQGRVRITIVDKLPADIDINDAGVDLDGGTYNREDRTITWTEEVNVTETYNETIEKEIQVVYKDQNILETLVNEVTGTVTIYYPENHTTDPGEERDTNTVTDTAEVEQEYKVIKEVEKVWDDNNDVKGNRPESVTVQLTANGNTNYNGEALEKVVLSNSNNWSYTFTDLPKYDGLGKEIEYSVVETETNAGDLEYYDTPVIIAETDTIVVTNKYRLMNTDIQSSINKTGTEKITSTKEKVTYNINYKVAITDYIGEAVIKVVDTLPYAIDEASSNLNGGTYDEATKTITWEERIEHINTYTDGTYEVEISKEVTLVYENIDATQREMTNQVRGTIDLYETEQTNTVEDTHDTAIEIPGNVIVKYVDRETGEEITEGYEIEGLVGETYTTEQKEIPAYTYIGNSGNTEGNIIEGTIKVTYYYEREAAGGVHVIYVDEEGNKIAEDENYEGKVGDPYETEEKDIYGYEYVRVEGEPEGEMTEDEIEVVYVYKKLPARVIVRYLEKDETPEDDSDNRVLYPEETIEGLVGDSYTTNRKEIENYQVAEPEPENKEGNMTEEDIYVTYYYEKIPSGKVIAQYVDIDTNEEILYKDEETGEYKTYREESQGYVEEEYTTEEKEIPYYKLIEELMPANKEGKYTEEDIYVTYYYEKLEFNIGIDKNVEEILINGEEQKVLDGKLNKVEVVGSRINSTEVKITYSIIVRNTGELGGTAVIEENIPKNFELNEETGEEWEETEDGSLEAEVELEAGETKELKVVLNWIKGNNRFGIQKNTVRIVETNNPAGYEETTTEDNTSSSEVVMGVKTGSEISEVAIIISLTGMIICVLVFIYISDKYIKEYKEKNGMIK